MVDVIIPRKGNGIGDKIKIKGTCRKVTVDKDLEKITPSDTVELSHGRSSLAGASVGNYALAIGGFANDEVDAYDTSLTRTTPTALSQARGSLAGASVGNYALAMGGYNYNDNVKFVAIVDAYDTSLTRTIPIELSEAKQLLAGASVGNYALAMGGQGRYYYDTVDAYDTSLTHTFATRLSYTRRSLAGASVGNYALAMGGYQGRSSYYYATVDAYDTSLTHSTPTALSQIRDELVGASVGGNYALAMGGYGPGITAADTMKFYATVDAYDTSLTRTTPTALSQGRSDLAGASVGNYALAMGGHDGGDSGNCKTIDIYSIKKYTYIELTLDDTSAFNDSGSITGNITLT